MANRLANASSPYLRQHAGNPVDWLEWGGEASARARERDVPIFLSVGYASCHWCHVMAHESFEDREVAQRLNADFVAVKVDREERPDVDAVYMGAVQAMTGRGGWPMSVFLTPDGTPFFGGTYWPRDGRGQMPGFLQVLEAVTTAWREQRDQVLDSGRRLAARLDAQQQIAGLETVGADPSVADTAAASCVRMWDRRFGGFGGAPKFPQAMTIDFLLAHHLRTGDAETLAAATHSLEAMSRGGIYDHVAGGFARYSVDDWWLVPHFEKMLYDNALLLRALVHAWQVTGGERFRRIAVETADYLVAEMQHPRGGFFSSTDADSEGVEGKSFVWSDAEFREVVAEAGEDAEHFARFYGVTAHGNFEGANILHEPAARDEDDQVFAAALNRARAALYRRREQRVAPGLDDKVLTSWNALALGALAEAGAALGEARYLAEAQRCAAFLRDELIVDGRLHHTWSEGHGTSVAAFLEDVACLSQALLVLYEADGDPAWFAWAQSLAREAQERFADGDTGTYFATAHDAERLVTRPKDLWDNATPGGSSVMVDVHLRLAGLTADLAHHDDAERTLAAFSEQATHAPTGYGELLRGMERMASGPQEVAIVAPAPEAATELTTVYREVWRPGAVLAVGTPTVGGNGATVPLLADRALLQGAATAYVCRNFACDRPVTTPDDLRGLLARR
ncbi:MAG: DUF255 domain-containing protein [Nitriliruptorales bacterium]|nr:DUF255 domain-containing protein [Nitriliruptorales bacterium]